MSKKKPEIVPENASRPPRDDSMVPRHEAGSRDQVDPRVRLRREISIHQGELIEAITDLREVFEERIERVNIRRRIVEDPWPWLAGGFAVGLILGLRGR